MGSLSGRKRKPAVPLPKDPEERRKIYVAALRTAAAELGAMSFSKDRYDAAARRLGLVSGSPIKKDFGTWTAALAAAFGRGEAPFAAKDSAASAERPTGSGAEEAAVAAVAEEVLGAAGSFKSLTHFYMLVARLSGQRGAPLRGKEAYGYDAVRGVLRRARPDLLEEARRKVEKLGGAPGRRGECARLLERKLAAGVLGESDFRATCPPWEIIFDLCVATGAEPQTIREAWRDVRAKLLGGAAAAKGSDPAGALAALRRISSAAEAAAKEIEALRERAAALERERGELARRVRGLEEEKEALAARARRLEEENARFKDELQRYLQAFETLLGMASEREKIEALKIAVDRCLNVLSVAPVRRAEAARN